MPNDDGPVADVQSRASSTLYNWNRLFNDQSVPYGIASRRGPRATGPWRRWGWASPCLALARLSGCMTKQEKASWRAARQREG